MPYSFCLPIYYPKLSTSLFRIYACRVCSNILVSRTTSMTGLRLLQYDEVGLNSIRKQMPDKYLYAWERGYDDNGLWSDKLAVTVLRNIRNSQHMEKQASTKKNRKQPFTSIKSSSPAKNALSPGQGSPNTSPHKRQRRYKCGLCNRTDHTRLQCPQWNHANRQSLFLDLALTSQRPSLVPHLYNSNTTAPAPPIFSSRSFVFLALTLAQRCS